MRTLIIILCILFTFLVGAAMAGSLRLKIFPARYPNLTSTQLHQKLLHSSISRAGRFHPSASFIPASPAPPYIRVDSSYGGLYYVGVPIGTPPVNINLAMDTASSPTWVQSASCRKCFKVTTPNFRAEKSSTFRRMPSNDDLCVSDDLLYPQGKFCGYTVSYAVNQFSVGDFGYDMLSDTELPFGLGFYNEMIDFKWDRKHKNQMAGILGLGRDHPSSLVHQLSSLKGIPKQFAYHLPADPRDEGFLVFGDEAELTGLGVKSTPILGNDADYYYLNMTGMSVNGSILPINPKLFMSDGEQGAVIDSGSQYSFFVPEAYQALQDSIVNFFYPTAPLPLSKSGFHLCYDLEQMSQPERSVLDLVPTITFHFEGADLQLQPDTSFKVFEDTNELCLMMLPITEPEFPNIFGGFQQLRYWFQFDLEASRLSFVPAED